MKLVSKFFYYFFFLLIILFPFQTLLGNIFEFRIGLPPEKAFWFLHWYEPIMFVGFLALLFKRIISKQKLILLETYGFLLLFLGFISILFLSISFGRGLEGFRFTLLSLIVLFMAFYSDIETKLKTKLINVYLYSSFFVAIWAIIERFLPLKYWNNWGLISSSANFGYGWHGAGGFWQSASMIGGPNQLASYLLPAFFILLCGRGETGKINIRETKKKLSIFLSQTVLKYFPLIIFLLAIVLAFSRAAIVGLVVGFLVWLFSQKNKALTIGTVSVLALASLFILWYIDVNPNFRQIISHGTQTGHQEALRISVNELEYRFGQPVKLFLGSGLGSAGPSAIKYKDGVISESWYLQLTLEIGVLGLVLWLLFIGKVTISLFKGGETGLFLGLIAVSVTALFLHTWADNPAMAFILFALIGLYFNQSKIESLTG